MEYENQVLRQQSLLNSSVKTMSEHLSTHVYEKLENGHHLVEDQKATETQTDTPSKKFGTQSDSKLRRSYIKRQHKLENGHHLVEDQKATASALISTETQTDTPVKKFVIKSDSKLRRSYIERQHENVDSLINCVMKNIGFHHAKPIATFTIYKCLHWKSFIAERTSVFDRLIQMIGCAI
ncbi:myosin-14-like [Trifolium pratense]|uniref:myosin-14-like n=1 Tax=Trifolium pratense TaxID=57577 RepID=UPI001E697146|nr:myosin-14-like [Trifolium pratense]